MLNRRKNVEKKIALHKTVLGFSLLSQLLIAFVFSIGVYKGSTILGEYIVNSVVFEQYMPGYEKQIKFDDFIKDDKSPKGRYVLDITDDMVTVISYEKGTGYNALIQTVAIFISVVVFIIILLSILRKTVSDIKKLSYATMKLADGDFDYEVRLDRKDEIGWLASDINEMRLSIIERMEKERKAVKANRDLITELSHDLRTPLTRQMCTLELAMKGQYKSEEEIHDCFARLYNSSEQIKRMSDELFSYFLTENSFEKGKLNFEEIDGNTLFAQIISENADYLESEGFHVNLDINISDSYKVNVDVDCLARIVDNLISNIKKYADSDAMIIIACKLREKYVEVSFENMIGKIRGNEVDSSNIGIHSARQLAKELNGNIEIIRKGTQYKAILKLPYYVEGE